MRILLTLIILSFTSTIQGCEGRSIYDKALDYLSPNIDKRQNSLAKRAATDPVEFKYSYLRYAHYASVKIGSKEDPVNVRLTDQPWFWIAGERPRNCSRAVRTNYLQCIYTDWSGQYDPFESDTFRNISNAPLRLTQSDEERFTRGYYGTDTVKFGDTNLDNVWVGIANNFTAAPQLGLGVYDDDRQSYTSFMEFLYTQRDINVLAHGLYFGWLERNQSYLTMGAVDTAKYEGNLVTFNATNNSEITVVDLLSASFGSPGDMDELVPVRNLRTNIEFSTGRLVLPDRVFSILTERTGAEYDEDWDGYLVDCDVRSSDLVFEFRFRDINITVEANHFVLPAYGVLGYRFQFRNKDACALQVSKMSEYGIANELGYEAVLGTPFAQHVYLVHDYSNRQLSFAPTRFNTTQSNVVVLDSRGVAPLYTPYPSATDPPNPTDPPQPEPTEQNGSSTSPGVIAGGVVGGVFGVAGLAGLAFFLLRRRKKTVRDEDLPPPPMMHNTNSTSPPAPSTVYSQIPAFDPLKPNDNQNDTRRYSEAPNNDPAFGGYGSSPQPAQGHPQFRNSVAETAVPYQENVEIVQYSEAPGNNVFAQELPGHGQRHY